MNPNPNKPGAGNSGIALSSAFAGRLIGSPVPECCRRAAMRPVQQFAHLALLAVLAGCSGKDRKPEPGTAVEVSRGLPASITNAQLQVTMLKPADATPTHYGEKISGRRSLNSPVGSSDNGQCFEEQRLTAVRADGFLMLFTKRDGAILQTNAVLFPYGETTETNTLGWNIIGRYK